MRVVRVSSAVGFFDSCYVVLTWVSQFCLSWIIEVSFCLA